MHVLLPDGTRKDLDDGATGADLAAAIGPGLARAALAVKAGGEVRDLARPLADGEQVEIVTDRSPDSLELIRHDTAHVLAAAVLDLFPGTRISIGPPIEDGFYYDFEFPAGVTVSEHDLPALEEKMREHVRAQEEFAREDVTTGQALARFRDEDQPYKVELIEDLVRDAGAETVSLYTNGPFTDLCRGPHAPDTGRIKAFKLLSLAGAYWRGDASRQMLTRIYGTAFHSAKELDAHLERLEQARARDHRKLGRELNLFMFSELSPGSPFWQPDGMIVLNELTALWRRENAARGYREVQTPILYDVELFRSSGHWDVYRENMYFTDVEDRPMGLKPMNCPAHIQLYNDARHSYRDLPIRYSEAGLVHRHEPSGTLHGLLRVRHITQDDAHIFCTEEQIGEEVNRCLDFGYAIYDTFGFVPRLELSTRPEKRIGTEEMWDRAEAALESALALRGVEFELNAGDGAFYGPKIDLHMTDSIGRSWQLGTVQLDYVMPERFELDIHRRRQRRAPARDDPPRADGLVRALHGHPDRALRGRVPALARAAAGARAAGLRPPRRLRRAGARAAGRRRAARARRRSQRVGRAHDPRRRAGEGAVHARGRRPRGRGRSGRPAPPRRGRPRHGDGRRDRRAVEQGGRRAVRRCRGGRLIAATACRRRRGRLPAANACSRRRGRLSAVVG